MNKEIIIKDITKRDILLYGNENEIEEFIQRYQNCLNIKAVLTDLKNDVKLQMFAPYGVETVMIETIDFLDELIILCSSVGFEGRTKRLRHLGRLEYKDYISQELVESLLYNKRCMVVMGTRLLFQTILLLKQSEQLLNRYNIIYFDEESLCEPYSNRYQEYLHICKVCDVYIRSSCEKERFYRKVINKKFLKKDCKYITLADYGFWGYFPQYVKSREEYSNLLLRERERLEMHYGILPMARTEKEIEPLCMQNKNSDEIMDVILSESYYTKQYIYNYFDNEVRRYAELEKDDDIKLSSYIDKHRNEILCRNPEEWHEPIISYVADVVLELLGEETLALSKQERKQIIEENSGSELLIYPCVANALQIQLPIKYRVKTYYNIRYLSEREYLQYLIDYYKCAYDLMMFMGIDEELENSILEVDMGGNK